MEIYPQPPYFSFGYAGPAYAMIAEENQVARIDALMTHSIEIDDNLRIRLSVLIIDSAPIEIYHGATLVGTLYGPGVAEFNHTAENGSALLRVQSTDSELRAFHLIGGISVDLNP